MRIITSPQSNGSAALKAVQKTNPPFAATATAFFIGNMFGLGIVAFVYILVSLPAAISVALGLLYLADVALDKSHRTGKRRSVAFLSSAYFRHLMQYFDMEVIFDEPKGEKRRELCAADPNQTYIMTFSPHGIHGFGMAAVNYEGKDSPFYQRYPSLRGKLTGLVASVLFRVPLVREIFSLAGYRDASGHVARRALAEGQSLFLIVGGEAESLLSKPGTDIVVAAGKKRKGFVRLALETGSPLVPCYMFHNTDTYLTSDSFFSFRKYLSKRFQICIPLFQGRFFSSLPFNVKQHVVIGQPVPFPEGYSLPAHPTGQQEANGKPKGRKLRPKHDQVDPAHIDAYHAAYLKELNDLFERNKAAAGYPADRKLVIEESN